MVKFNYGDSTYVLEKHSYPQSFSYLKEYINNCIKASYVGFDGYELTIDKLMRYQYLVLAKFKDNNYFYISESLNYESNFHYNPGSDFLINLDLITDEEFINARNVYSLLEN